MLQVFFNSSCITLLLHDIFRASSLVSSLDACFKASAFCQQPFHDRIFPVDFCFIDDVMACIVRNGRVSSGSYEKFDCLKVAVQ